MSAARNENVDARPRGTRDLTTVAQPGHDNGAAGRSERDGGATAVAGTVAVVADTVRGGSAQQPDPGECSGGAKQTTRTTASPRMNIGFFTDSYFPGIDGVTYTIRAWRIGSKTAATRCTSSTRRAATSPTIERFPPSLPNLFYSQYRVPLYRRISTLPDLDVVHCHGPASTGLMGRRYAKKRDVKSVYTHHTPVEDYFVQGLKLELLAGIAGRAYVAYENRFLQSFDCVTASTSRIRRDVTPRKLPVGIEMDTFRPVTDSQFASDEPTVGYSGRMTRKNTSTRSSGWPTGCPTCGSNWWGGPVRDDLERGAPRERPVPRLPPARESSGVLLRARRLRHRPRPATRSTLTLEANACGPRSPPPTCPHLTGPLGRTTAPGSTTATSTTWSAPSSTVSTATGRPDPAVVEGSPSSGR